MELNVDEQNLIASYRKLSENARRELARFVSALLQGAKTAAEEDGDGPAGTCKISRDEKRPETADEPICTE